MKYNLNKVLKKILFKEQYNQVFGYYNVFKYYPPEYIHFRQCSRLFVTFECILIRILGNLYNHSNILSLLKIFQYLFGLRKESVLEYLVKLFSIGIHSN